MFLVNSCLGRFSAANSRWHPFSRSYGVNLPSSLTTLLPMALGSSPHLPVSVCGTGSPTNTHTFSRHRIDSLRLIRLAYARGNQRPVELLLCVSVINNWTGYGISTVCASPTPCGLSLAPENRRFPGEGSSAQGKPGAKLRPEGVGDAHTVEIP